MLPRLKNLKRYLLPLCAAAAIALGPLQAAPAFAQPAAEAGRAQVVPVRIGEHREYTRLVFDFTQLTAYSAARAGDSVLLTFESPGRLGLPGDSFHLITGMKTAKPDAGSITLSVGTAPGTSFRDYRIVNKIVLDVYAPAKKPAPQVAAATPKAAVKTPRAAKAPPKATPKPAAVDAAPAPSPSPAAPPAAAPAETAATEPVKPPVKIVSETPQGPLPEPPAILVEQTAPAPEPQPAYAPEPTTLLVATLEPTRLAVFTRHDFLWVVLDSQAAGAVQPAASGPEAGLFSAPKVLKLKNGTAYRYALPQQRYVSVEKQNLTWRISLSPAPLQTPANGQVNVEFDTSTGRATLLASLKDAAPPVELPDPAAGDTLHVIPAAHQGERIDQARRFANVEIIPAAIGMVVKPHADDIRVTRIQNFVLVSAPGGIIATAGAVAGPAAIGPRDAEEGETRLFDFPAWRQGGATKLYRNRRLLEDRIAAASSPAERQDLLMKLALLYFANNFGQEAVGVLRLIETESEGAARNPNFVALRGAARAMAGHFQDALKDLSHPLLQHHSEIKLWVGYAAAASEQWRMANRSFPATNRLLLQYPDNISVPFTIYMAESALRLGHAGRARTLLDSLDSMSGDFEPHYRAAIQYLRGEAARQAGNADEAIRLWTPVAFGLDRLYHAKAALALTNLKLQGEKITLKQAIDAVDSLRFAWRGDGLEVQILHNLGMLKVKDGQFLSGLEDMNRAAALADELLDDSDPIREDMSRVFYDLFVGGAMKSIPPLEAVSIYTGYSSLMPQGADGTAAKLNFADSLIGMDLLDKAEALLESELKGGRLSAAKASEVGAKLAALYLLDGMPDKALAALGASAAGTPEGAARAERDLLKARALSQLDRTDEAIGALSQIDSREAAHLKADVLWRARKWGPAAAATEALLPQPGAAPLNEEEARMVVNAAVGYKLAGETEKLAQLRQRYAAAIEATPLGATFGVVTRNSGRTSLADRDTLLKIAGEVDMFKSFLDNYKAGKTL